MSNARIQSRFQLPAHLSAEEKKKEGDILLDVATKLLEKAKAQYENKEIEQKLDAYRDKYRMNGKSCYEPSDPKKTLNQAMFYLKKSMNLGNQQAKLSYKEAKNYYKEIFAEEEGFILVRMPSDLEADVAFDGKNAISKIREKKVRSKDKTEIVNTSLLSKINIISNWYRDPLVCKDKIPIKMPSPIIQIS